MHRRIKPFENRVPLGSRVLVDVPGIKLRQPGTVIGLFTQFAGTPEKRRVVCRIAWDNKIYHQLIGEVFESQVHILESEAE